MEQSPDLLGTLTREQTRALIQAVIEDTKAGYDILNPDHRRTALIELMVRLDSIDIDTYEKFTDVLNGVLVEASTALKATDTSPKSKQRMENLLCLVETTLGRGSLKQKAYLPSLIRLVDKGADDIVLCAARVLSNYDNDDALTTLERLYEKDRSNPAYAGFLLNARALRDTSTAFDFDLAHITRFEETPGFILAFQNSMTNMFETDGQKAFDAVRRNAIRWSPPVLALTEEVLEDITDGWAKTALQFVGTLTNPNTPALKM